MRKILVLRGGALGDFVVTLPALALLRARWPDAQIELAGNATAAQLALSRGLLNAVHSQHESRWSGLFGNEALPSPFSRWLADFDLVINFWPHPDGGLQRHFPRRPDQVFLTAPAQPRQSPAAAHYCAPLRALGIEARDFSFSLFPPSANRARDLALAIHPGSGSPRKNWPRKNWRELIARLQVPASLILGEAERTHWSSFSCEGIAVIAEAPLEDLVAHFSRCRLFLGHDSGISHLAAACGARCLLLFGPTDPLMWAPPLPGVRVLQAGAELASLSVGAVEQAVAAALSERA